MLIVGDGNTGSSLEEQLFERLHNCMTQIFGPSAMPHLSPKGWLEGLGTLKAKPSSYLAYHPDGLQLFKQSSRL